MSNLKLNSKIQVREELISSWYAVKERLDEVEQVYKDLKRQENAAKAAILEDAFPNGIQMGTSNVDIGYNCTLKITIPRKYEVDVAAYTSVQDQLTNTLIRHKYELNAAVYKALPEEQKKIADSFVTTKTGSPTVKIVSGK